MNAYTSFSAQEAPAPETVVKKDIPSISQAIEKTAATKEKINPNNVVKYGTREEALLNSVELHPMTTGEEYVDKEVERILSLTTNSSMSNYEKVCSIYQYIHQNFFYQTSFIAPTTKYKSYYDRQMVGRTEGFLKTGHGTCTEYSACFMTLTRALGFESYCIGGAFSGSGRHTWAIIVINGEKYIFDPEIDSVVAKRMYGGTLHFNYFCLSEDDEFWAKYYPNNVEKDIKSFKEYKIAE